MVCDVSKALVHAESFRCLRRRQVECFDYAIDHCRGDQSNLGDSEKRTQ